jgi:hypothetical protein
MPFEYFIIPGIICFLVGFSKAKRIYSSKKL